MKTNWSQGIFEPKNIDKYKGTLPIEYRSSWEQRVFYFLDAHPSVISWSSESVVIPYKFSIDNSMHRYFVDIACIIIDKQGLEQRYLIEIKPENQTRPPEQPKRKTPKAIARFNQQQMTYVKNQDKWKAAEAWAVKNGYKFQIWTEKTLGL